MIQPSDMLFCIEGLNCRTGLAVQVTFFACLRSCLLHCLKFFFPNNRSSKEVTKPSRALKTPLDTQSRSMLASKLCFVKKLLCSNTKHAEALYAHVSVLQH